MARFLFEQNVNLKKVIKDDCVTISYTFCFSYIVLPLPYLESIVENVQNSLNGETKDLIERCKFKHLISIYSILMQHQHAKVNYYLDSLQTLRPPSYNSLTRSHSDVPVLSSHYQNGIPFQINSESLELLQEVIAILQQNVSYNTLMEKLFTIS